MPALIILAALVTSGVAWLFVSTRRSISRAVNDLFGGTP